MHNIIQRILLPYWLAAAWGVLPVLAQVPPQIDASNQLAVATLRAVAQAIKECPRELRSEKKSGKELERRYIGPPQNVVWDVKPSISIRAPYVGYIEFALQFTRWDASASTFVDDSIFPVPRRRYEFDVSPKGLELTRMLHYGGPTTEQRTELFDDPPDDSCWQKAARNAQTIPMTMPPGFVAVPVGFATACAIEVSGNSFLSWCDANNNEDTRQACKDWLHGFYTGVHKETAANSGLACSPNVTDDELFNSVLKYLKDHPGDRDKRTGDLVVIVLKQAFPCKH